MSSSITRATHAQALKEEQARKMRQGDSNNMPESTEMGEPESMDGDDGESMNEPDGVKMSAKPRALPPGREFNAVGPREKSALQENHAWLFWMAYSFGQTGFAWILVVLGLAAADLGGVNPVSVNGWQAIQAVNAGLFFVWWVIAVFVSVINWRFEKRLYADPSIRQTERRPCPMLFYRGGGIFWRAAVWAVLLGFFTKFHADHIRDEWDQTEQQYWRDLMWATVLAGALTTYSWFNWFHGEVWQQIFACCKSHCYDY